MTGTRQRIVDAASRQFYEHGSEATPFTAIAEAVGISRGNSYCHFTTKDEILAAVVEARVAADPFVVHDVVRADVVDVDPNHTDPRLAFLAGTSTAA